MLRLHYLGAAAATAVSYAAAVKQADTVRRKFGEGGGREGDERLLQCHFIFHSSLAKWIIQSVKKAGQVRDS